MSNNERAQFTKAWKESAIDDLETARGLMKLKRYSGCLFFCHLAVEKILKAVFLKRNNTYPPVTHKLVKLASLSKIKVDSDTKKHLVEITTFNVEARYDILKERLYKKATKDYTVKYFAIAKQLIKSFKKLL